MKPKFIKKKTKTTKAYLNTFKRLDKRFHVISKKIDRLLEVRTIILNEIEKLAIEIDQRQLQQTKRT